MSNIYAERIDLLRALMRKNGWCAVIISGSDPHSSEYVAPRWQQVKWISGFTGEAGDVVITEDHAGLWTDTRYFIQAAKQLPGTGIELHKTNVPDQVLIPEWLAKTQKKIHRIIAVDGLCQSVSAIEEIEEAFVSAGKARPCIVGIPDMLDELWSDRPAIPAQPVTLLSDVYTGSSRSERIAWLREEIQKRHCDAMLITALDEIAWLLNIRGSDIEYNPIVLSYLLITPSDTRLYIQKSGTPDEVTAATFAALEADDVRILPYDAVLEDLKAFEGELFVDKSSLNYCLHEALSDCGYIAGESPIILKKSIKNATEIEGMRKAHIVDGVAVVRFLHWLEDQIKAGKTVSEWDAAVQLGKFRSECPDYRGDSFETISAWGEGAALPHYVTPSDGSTLIGNHGLYLCDSGGQYLYGTTDITRTVAVGPCTDLEKEDYTLVLQGHIRLAMCIFPKGTAGCQIDVLAREPLWRRYRNFGHGTGHGVGFYLNVHEGPQNIRQGFKNQPLLPGMITSNEPGLYREGMYGIRHENLILCVDAGVSDFGRDWLKFETITMCYFDTAPIKNGILLPDEVAWLNAYNESVYRTLAPHLDSDDTAWLRMKTMPI